MIISHKHKFIFIKTKKTAGTSLEIALSSICGPDDILTPFSRHGEKVVEDDILRDELGFRSAQHYRKRLSELSLRDIAYTIYNRKRPMKFTEHDFARDVKAKIDPKIFDDYYKFAVMRNPFDAAVSAYYWYVERRSADLSFLEFLISNPASVNINWALCTDATGRLLVDDFLRFEHFATDLEQLSDRLGLAENLYDTMKNVRAKGNVRPSKSRKYHDVMDDESRRLIEILCKHEIEHFGHAF